MALDKEISQTIETVSKAVNDANQKMIQEKTPKVPNDGTEVPGEKK
jgi:DNA-binding FrmR family transcriptional regulator